MFTIKIKPSTRIIATAASVVMLLTGVSLASGSANAADPILDRPLGPCDIYQDNGFPCATAHSTTRALFAGYDGALYQVTRVSDGAVKDIPLVAASTSDPGGYANAAVQDQFCANDHCWISMIYDQTANHNDLKRGPRGAGLGTSMGGYNQYPVADMAPITLGGHKVYGTYSLPTMGLRNNNTNGMPVDDQPASYYMIANGQHFNQGCCFNYGNASISSQNEGSGTMETVALSANSEYGWGGGTGPWIMSDQEANIIPCSSRNCPDVTPVTSRFVTAITKGWSGGYTIRGADSQNGVLKTQFSGGRISSSYDPMRKQGAILLGTGGDNAADSQGTFYEGAVAVGYPTDAVDQLMSDNVTTAKYDVAMVAVMPTQSKDAPPAMQTFAPGVASSTTVKFTNTTDSRLSNVVISLNVPTGWSVSGPVTVSSVGIGRAVSVDFTVKPGTQEFNGDVNGVVKWGNRTETHHLFVRNTAPIKINELKFRTASNQSDAFIELYNAGDQPVDISGWELAAHATQQPTHSVVKVPDGTIVSGHGFYVMGMSTSGLAAPAGAGTTDLLVRSVTGLAVGQQITIGTGADAQTARITRVGTASTINTRLWQQLPEASPYTVLPAGSTNLGVDTITGFTVGQKMLIGSGDTLEVVQITSVGTAGSQVKLSSAATAGATNIKVSAVTNLRAPFTVQLDVGARREMMTVTAVGTAGATGTGLTLAAPLQFNHSSNTPFSSAGSGISFTPATQFNHITNEPIQALGSGITIDQPLAKDRAINDVILNTAVTTAGFQGTPNQWYGGPNLMTFHGNINAGAIQLRNADGLVADSLSYGLMVDAWLLEGYNANFSYGCKMIVPPAGTSMGRIPDGNDTDSSCYDFQQSSTPTPGYGSSFSFPAGSPIISLQVASDPSLYVMNVGDVLTVGKITENSTTAEKKAASFVAIPALNGTANCISLMSVARPGFVFRTLGGVYNMTYNTGTTLFGTDSSMCPVSSVATGTANIISLASPRDGVRFRTMTTSRYIRLLNGERIVSAASSGTNLADQSPSTWQQDILWNSVRAWAMTDGKAELQALVDQAKALNPGHFTNYYAMIPIPLAAAQVVLDAYDPGTSVIQGAYDTLAAAMAGLQTIMGEVVLTNPVMTGDAMVGHTLSVSTSAFPDDAALSYEWFRGCDTGVAISGANASTYVVQLADAGASICAKVTASLSPWFAPGSKFSNAMDIQVPIQIQQAALPTTGAVGQALTINLAYTPSDAAYTVEWYRNGTELIAGANTLKYVVQQADSGGELVAKITVLKPGFDNVVTFTNTVSILGNKPPAGTIMLAPAGPVTPGTPLTLTYDVTPADAFTLAEWYVGGNVVMISTNPFDGHTYTPTASDAGKTVVVKLTVYVPSFSPLVLFSNAVDIL